MAADGADMPINRVEMNDTSVGVITSGIPYQYVKEAMPNASVLKLGMVNPLPRKMIEDFAAKVDKLYVIEELEPHIETQVRAWGIDAVGKELLTVQGEYSANMLREKILGEKVEQEEPAKVAPRPPILCPGCPHRSVFSVLNELKIHAAGDIGCYTLGAVAPLSVIDTTVCMGSSISTLHGMEKAKGKDYIKNWVAVIGDSTFMHTGVNSLMNMVYNKGTGTVIILDNSTTGMTAAIDGTCDIGMASRELKDSEKSAGLTNQVIALDGIAVIVNNKNSASNITSEQVKAIFTGETTDWSNVK